jgi:hypothetical protein
MWVRGPPFVWLAKLQRVGDIALGSLFRLSMELSCIKRAPLDPWRRLLPNISSRTMQINPSRPHEEGVGISFRILEKGNQIGSNAMLGCQQGNALTWQDISQRTR